jgi:hypothetical protein
MKWTRLPVTSAPGMSIRAPIPSSRYVAEDYSGATYLVYSVDPRYLIGRGGRRLKRVVWHLHENGRMIGRPFNSARLAKAFAEALNAIGDDRRARDALIRDGAGWCYDREREWRDERLRRRNR